MGKAKKAAQQFIKGISDNTLKDLPNKETTLTKDVDFRLDMQKMTNDTPPRHDLQVQINNGTTISTLKREKGKTVAHYNAAHTDTGDVIRAALLKSVEHFLGGDD